jgi:hypothetical protein
VIDSTGDAVGVNRECETASRWHGEPLLALVVEEAVGFSRTSERVDDHHEERLLRQRTGTAVFLERGQARGAPERSGCRGLEQERQIYASVQRAATWMPAACIDSSAPARQSYFYDADEDGPRRVRHLLLRVISC